MGLDQHEEGCGYVDVEMKGDWGFEDVPMAAHTGVRTSLRGGFNTIREQCTDNGLDIPENANNLFGLALYGLGAIEVETAMELARDDAVVAKNAAVSAQARRAEKMQADLKCDAEVSDRNTIDILLDAVESRREEL